MSPTSVRSTRTAGGCSNGSFEGGPPRDPGRTRETMSRIGTGLLWAGGLVLAGLMGYTLTLDGGSATPRRRGAPAGVAEVAVVFPERVYWVEFRQGVLACVRRGL